MVQWHPILATREFEAGHWEMVGQWEQVYGVIRLLEANGERGYRAVTWAERSEDRELIGYYRTLRAATMAAHRHFIAQHGVGGPINGR